MFVIYAFNTYHNVRQKISNDSKHCCEQKHRQLMKRQQANLNCSTRRVFCAIRGKNRLGSDQGSVGVIFKIDISVFQFIMR